MEKHAVQVLVLAHAYQVPWLKRACEGAIGARLTADSVVDVLQLADLCDAPCLHLRCARLLAKEFAAVERTEAWRFLQENDPWQELHVLQRLHEADMVRFFPSSSSSCSPLHRPAAGLLLPDHDHVNLTGACSLARTHQMEVRVQGN